VRERRGKWMKWKWVNEDDIEFCHMWREGKKVFEFENLSDIGRSEKCHMCTFLQTDSFLYNWIEPFCCLAQFKKCPLHSQNSNMAYLA
jgi:hypothetical protein